MPTTEAKAAIDAATDGLDIRTKLATRDAVEWIDQAIERFEQAARDLRERRGQFVTAVTEPKAMNVAPATILGWIVNDINNVERNHRLDMAVEHAVRLTHAMTGFRG